VARPLLVYNPCSGAREPGRLERIAARLEPSIGPLDVRELLETDDAEAIAKASVAGGAPLVVGAGGDGTISSCAGAVIGSGAHLGIVPCGTSNSIARALGVPTDLEGACDAVALGRVREIDAARANGRPMALLASIGFHADTIETTPPDAKAVLGKLAYVIRGIQHLREYESFDVEVETDRGSAKLRAMAVTIANVAPAETIFAHGAGDVVPDDGLLDLTIASADGALGALAAGIELAVGALRGTEVQSPHVGWVRCRRARLVASPAQHVVVDGEVVGTTPLEVAVVPRGLSVRIAGP
jgi:YegS/Rv2252/BmrU family lipid kinase